VLVGVVDPTTAERKPEPDAAEVDAWCWVGVAELRAAVGRSPQRFTPWLPLALPLAVARFGPDGPGCSAG
jgi:isopentenyldiphosphate isomerase